MKTFWKNTVIAFFGTFLWHFSTFLCEDFPRGNILIPQKCKAVLLYIFHFLLCLSISTPFFSPFSEEKEGNGKKKNKKLNL